MKPKIFWSRIEFWAILGLLLVGFSSSCGKSNKNNDNVNAFTNGFTNQGLNQFGFPNNQLFNQGQFGNHSGINLPPQGLSPEAMAYFNQLNPGGICQNGSRTFNVNMVLQGQVGGGVFSGNLVNSQFNYGQGFPGQSFAMNPFPGNINFGQQFPNFQSQGTSYFATNDLGDIMVITPASQSHAFVTLSLCGFPGHVDPRIGNFGVTSVQLLTTPPFNGHVFNGIAYDATNCTGSPFIGSVLLAGATVEMAGFPIDIIFAKPHCGTF